MILVPALSKGQRRTFTIKLSKLLQDKADLEPGKDVEVLLHVCPKHLLNDSRPQSPVVCLGHFLHTSTALTQPVRQV